MTTTTSPALNRLQDFLHSSSNTDLAHALREAVTGDNRDLTSIENHIRVEARHRVSLAAQAAEDAAWEAFNAKHYIDEAMTSAELDAIFDQIPSNQMVPGEWHWLVQALLDN